MVQDLSLHTSHGSIPMKAKRIEQDKLARFERIKKVISHLEKQKRQILKQGELAPEKETH
jgi:hypothetical protein